MIIVNGKKYTESVAEMVDSLFNDGSGTLPLLPDLMKKQLKQAAEEYKKKSLSGVTVENKAGFESVCMATQVMSLLNK